MPCDEVLYFAYFVFQATFTDILKELGKPFLFLVIFTSTIFLAFAFMFFLPISAGHYGIDLTPRKAAIKLMIQEELTKLAEQEEDDENDEEGEGEGDDE